jgi:hypothetical protein
MNEWDMQHGSGIPEKGNDASEPEQRGENKRNEPQWNIRSSVCVL